MQKITLDQVMDVSEIINNFSDAEAERLVNTFTEEQPVLMTYLLAVYGEELTEEEREYLFFLGLKIWYTLRQTVGKLPSITEEQLDKIEHDNEQMLHYLSEESEDGFMSFAENLVEDYSQGELIEFVIMAIADEGEDEDEPLAEEDDFILSEDAKGIFFIALKTLIDCFERFGK